MMKNKFLIAVLFMSLSTLVLAQRPTSFLELGGYGMSQNYLGDVNSNSLSAFTQEARFGAGAQIKYNFSSLWSVGADVNFGDLYSHDNLHGNESRDYKVDTEILQMGVFTNLHFIPFGKYNLRHKHTPFLHLGMNALTYQPNLNTNAQYPDEIELYPGTGRALGYSIGFGWRIRRSLKSFYNVGVFYNGFGVSNIEGFNYSDEFTAANPGIRNSLDGCMTLKLGMSLGFFEQ
ncbi:MAG: DUF6089 family protein [Schleiferiaceae bacterium]